MSIKILTSGFDKDFPEEFVLKLQKIITKRDNFVFVASDFDNSVKTDGYSNQFLTKFSNANINFKNVTVLDNRVSYEKACQALSLADVV